MYILLKNCRAPPLSVLAQRPARSADLYDIFGYDIFGYALKLHAYRLAWCLNDRQVTSVCYDKSVYIMD